MIIRLIDRILYSGMPVTLAVPEHNLESFARIVLGKKIFLFGGSEEDVLDRYYKAAAANNADPVIRVTGDNPLTSVETLVSCVKEHIAAGADITHPSGDLPYGSGVEVISFSALEKAWKHAADPFEREHITQYHYRNKASFTIQEIPVPEYLRYTGLRLTIDTKKDFDFYCSIIDRFPEDATYIRLTDILKSLRDRPVQAFTK